MLLNRRLLQISRLIRKNKKVCDVGTDHAYLACHVINDGISQFCIACDINVNPLARAKENIKSQNLQDQIELVLSDGLKEIDKDKVEDIVIAGMGGELIYKILTDVDWTCDKEKHYILQPMTQAVFLRENLIKSGFEILKEVAVLENDHLYTIMSVVYTGQQKQYPPYFYHFSHFLEYKDELSILYVKKEFERLNKIYHALEASGSEQIRKNKIKSILSEVESYTRKGEL